MLGFLKKKLSKVVDSLSKKAEEKEEKVEETIEEAPIVEEPVEPSLPEPVKEEPVEVELKEEPPKEEPEPEETAAEESEPVHEVKVEKSQKDELKEEPFFVEEVMEEKSPLEDGLIVEDTKPETVIKEPEKEPEPVKEPEAVKEPEPVEEQEAPELKPEPVLEKVKAPAVVQPEPEIKKEEKKSFFKKLTEKVVKKVVHKKLSESDVDPILSEFEDAMIESDVAVEVAEKIKGDMKSYLVNKEIKRGQEKEIVVESLRRSLMDILDIPRMDLEKKLEEKKPLVVVFWGFNGAGKTTSLAKTANWLKGSGHTCVLAAADTFRAGAAEQLGIHAERIGSKIIKHKYGADPAAVIFDAIEHAKARSLDFVLADTAGRAHTNSDLMQEMKKIVRVNKPDLKILVIDSLTGNDALMQARMYGEIGVDAIVFTKVDVNEKGGAILSVTHELKKPILFLGQGQEYSDFEEFDAKKFVDNLLS